jgi:hypothetical protein
MAAVAARRSGRRSLGGRRSWRSRHTGRTLRPPRTRSDTATCRARIAAGQARRRSCRESSDAGSGVATGARARAPSGSGPPVRSTAATRVSPARTAFAGDAIAIGASHLEMDNRRRPRAVWIVSDGGWYDTEAGVRKIRWLAELGAPRSTSQSAPSHSPSKPAASVFSATPPTAWTSSPAHRRRADSRASAAPGVVADIAWKRLDGDPLPNRQRGYNVGSQTE